MRTPSPLLLVVLLTAVCVRGDEEAHSYEPGEPVVVWADTVGPFDNPHENYPYEDLPLCELKDVDIKRKPLTLGEALGGHSLVTSPRLAFKFGTTEKTRQTICSMRLLASDVEDLRAMVRDHYWYVYYVDDLPVFAFLGDNHDKGEESGKKNNRLPSMFTHRKFTIEKNGNQIISVDMTPSNPVTIEADAQLRFTYEVEWVETQVSFARRFDRYLSESFFEQKVHWFSIVNSFVLCLFLCAVVAIILMRTLKNDFAKYAVSDAEELESLERAEESGWKQVHGDVFRKPTRLLLFSVFVSCGVQLAFAAGTVLAFAAVNSYYVHRGTAASTAVFAYVLWQPVAGYQGGKVFKMFSGKGWKRAAVLQSFALPGLALCVFLPVHTVALLYGSSRALPFTKTFAVLALAVFVCFPLHMLGTVVGRKSGDHVSFPCRIHALKRPIPPKAPLFLPSMAALAGLVPFGSLFVEVYFVFSSVWGYKFYYVYGFLFAIFLLFCCVLCCVSVTCVYVLLNAEDYRWAWLSFASCASTAVYVALYAAYFYLHSTRMSGLLQLVYYVGTTLFFCTCLGLFSGALGYLSASRFVWTIYRSIKSD